VKYDEGPSVEVTIDVAAAPHAIWPVITDINLPARFSDEFQGASWCGAASGPAPGASFVGRNRHPAIGEWETTCFVTECEPDRAFGWAVSDAAHPSATWTFGLEAHGDGTRVTFAMRMGPARSGLNIAIDAMPDKEDRIIARRLEEHQANMAETLAGIKAAVEQPR